MGELGVGSKEESSEGGSNGRGIISEFFYHLLTYSIFKYDNGSIFLFNNPYTFIPISTLAILQFELKKEIPKEAFSLMEWLGRVDGRTAASIMVSKYGMSKKNVEKLLSAATLTGLGNLSLKKVSNNEVIVTCNNSPLSVYYKESYGKSKEPVDCYIMGALAGSDVPIFGKKSIAIETKCIGKGDSFCEYDLKEGNYKPPKIIQNALKKSPELILDEILNNFLKKLNRSSISFRSKNIHFGDGNFTFNNIKGIAIPLFVPVLLNEILYKYKKSVRDKIIYKMASSYVEEVIKINEPNKVLTNLNIDKTLDSISMFGFGRFKLKNIRGKNLQIELSSNNYAKEYLLLFGYKNEQRDYLLLKILEELFKKSYGYKNAVCNELSCINMRSKSCLFNISLS